MIHHKCVEYFKNKPYYHPQYWNVHNIEFCCVNNTDKCHMQVSPAGCLVNLHHWKHFVHKNMRCHSISFLGLDGKFFLSDSDLALSALLHCNSFRPVFCLTQHIICKWIFKDLHIYITEFLSLKFSKSAKFCPEYVNFLLVSRSWEHSGGEHVCCWLRSQTWKHFSLVFYSPTNADFCGVQIYLQYPLLCSCFFSLKMCLRGESGVCCGCCVAALCSVW